MIFKSQVQHLWAESILVLRAFEVGTNEVRMER